MNIVCGSCSAKYTIAEDKVRGRKVKIRCKSCGTPIVVDGQGASATEPPTDADAALLDAAEAGGSWSVNLSDTDSRTMSVEEIVAGWKSGLVTHDAFVWKDGMGDWVPVLESELAPLLGKSPSVPPGAPPPSPLAQAPEAAAPAAAPAHVPAVGRGTIPLFMAPKGTPGLAAATAAQPAARASAARNQEAQDLFGGIDAAGSEEDVATSAHAVPTAGGAARDDGKLTGARNENSVLFSLDALKAGFAGPSAAPTGASKAAPPPPKGKGSGPARPQQISNPDDPFGMGNNAGITGLGGVGFNLADNHALLTAPAPPPPPPPVAFDPSGAPLPQPASKTKLGILIGVGAGALVLALVIGISLGKKKSADGGVASAQASAEPVKADGKPADTAPAASAAVEAKPDTSAAEASSAAPAASADKPAAVAAASKPGSDVKKPDKPKDEPAPAADAPPFSKASAISALGSASSAAASCKKPGGPTGTGKATVTFAPSGRVTTATVAGGSFAGTPVGGCVAGIFRKAKVPAFSGSSVTVSKSFSIN